MCQGAALDQMAGRPDTPPDDGDILLPPMGMGAGLPTPPDENSVRQLVSMGFSEAQVRAALAATNNNVQLATDRLLDNAASGR